MIFTVVVALVACQSWGGSRKAMNSRSLFAQRKRVVESKSARVGDSGSDYIISYSAPGGYVPAMLSDLKTTTFVNSYNANGLDVDSTSQPLPSSGACGLIAVYEGVLDVGSLLSHQYFAPYSASGNPEGGSTLSGPVFFGLTNPASFIGANINTTFMATVNTRSATEACPSGTTSSAVWTIWVKADFIVAAYGQGISPPSSDAMPMDVADLQSSHFANSYNTNGLGVYGGSQSITGCCVFKLHHGYLGIGSTVMQPYHADGNNQCGGGSSSGSTTLSGAIWFGLRGGDYIGQLNYSTRFALAELSSSYLPSSCGGDSTAFALYKVHPSSGPPHTGSCYEVELQVGFDTTQQGICLADRWRHTMRINTTYDTIKMDSLNECGFPINMHQVTIQPYTDTHAVVSSEGGATQCPCTGQVIVPYDMSNYTEMATICTHRVGEFHWCNLVFQFDRNGVPFKCPPLPPVPRAVVKRN